MRGSNLKPLLRAAAKVNIKSNAGNSNLTFLIRKRLIGLANRVKSEAYQLHCSGEILTQFHLEIDQLRLMAKLGGDL